MLQSDKRYMDLTMGILANRDELFGKLVNLSIILDFINNKVIMDDTKNEQE